MYSRLSPEQKKAVDLLEFGDPRLEFSNPSAAERGRAKTVLGWKRTREETLAYAVELLEAGMVQAAIAIRLDVSDRYLRELLKAR